MTDVILFSNIALFIINIIALPFVRVVRPDLRYRGFRIALLLCAAIGMGAVIISNQATVWSFILAGVIIVSVQNWGIKHNHG